ncbi:glutamate receptor 2.7-like [Neltuma alba]|uniref:glutamate receptor 2.7-like n=1 Tax=Neltuma alba TaxID=207710 RepID=UPI0010A2AD7B|nr:glutamate receptor 2.7-like [Prosopis alba]
MQRRRRAIVILTVGLVCLMITLTQSETESIPVGVILDSDSSLGSMALSCINISLRDFYSTHDSNSTKLQLHFRDSGKNLTTAASAARDLINKEKVHAILGPKNSEQARFVVELGNKSGVPVIWFSLSGPSLLPPRSRFLIHSISTGSQCSQFEAIAAIIQAYNWQSVIPIYEEPEFGNDLIPCLSYALQDMDTRMPYTSSLRQDSSDDQITQELKNIKGNRTYVFLAHMTVDLWSRLLKRAQKEGLMSEGYVWILTQGLSSVLNPEALDKKAKGYMDGALGVKPSLDVSNITKRASLATTLKSKYGKTLSLYGLWAYDTITALANAVEKAELVNSASRYRIQSGVDLRNETGPELRKAIQDTDFQGLSGDFNLSQGQLETSQIVVYNVKGQNESIIGHWSPENGLKLIHNQSEGNATERLAKLKIGVPRTHFTEFVNYSSDPEEGQNKSAAGGFAVDVFKRVVDVLPFSPSYDFVPVNIMESRLPRATMIFSAKSKTSLDTLRHGTRKY